MAIPRALRNLLVTAGVVGTPLVGPAAVAVGPMLIAGGLLGLWVAKELSERRDQDEIKKTVEESLKSGRTFEQALRDLREQQGVDSMRLESLLGLVAENRKGQVEAEKHLLGNQQLLVDLTQFVADRFEELREPLGFAEEDRAELRNALADLKKGQQEILTVAQRTDEGVALIVQDYMRRLQTAEAENSDLRKQLESAVRARVQAEQAAGEPLDEIIAKLRGGETHEFLEFLDERVEKEEHDLVERHRERAAVSYVVGDINRCTHSLGKILALSPNDLDAINRMGHIQQLRGELANAEASYRRVLELCGDDRGWQAAAFGNLGMILQTRSDLDGAESLHRKSLVFNEELGSKEGMAANYGNLGVIQQARDDLDGAESLHRKSLVLNEELGSKEGMAIQYGNLGLILRTRGELDSAESLHQKSLAISEELGRKEMMANQYGNLGVIQQARDDLDGAESLYRKSLAISEELGRKEVMAIQYSNLGVIHQIRGELDGAESLHRKSLSLDEELGNKNGMAKAYGNLGAIAQHRGKTREARKLWERSLALFTEIGAVPMIEKIQGWLDGLPSEGE
ncbi:tetratricopeptide repeat protein [Planctomycetaceae bacterium AH-315-I19]|nr:tetratricopeptide repeat protein [Planctomycetaceae bacterium AH-315-I19]